MPSPRYFFAMFGDPHPPEHDTVESGIYHPDAAFAPFPVVVGDVLLLYCTGGYAEFAMTVPGIGIAIHVDNEVIKYNYFDNVRLQLLRRNSVNLVTCTGWQATRCCR